MTHRIMIRGVLITSALAGLLVLFTFLGYAAISSHGATEKVEAAPKFQTTTTVSLGMHNVSIATPGLIGIVGLETTLPATYHFRVGAPAETQASRLSEPSPNPFVVSPDAITAVSSDGMVPVFYKLQTQQPVVFLTIDDGVVKDPAVASFMADHHIVASLFLNDSRVSSDYDYFRALQSAGNPIENHTVSHHNLTKLTYEQQKKEICDNADSFATAFGKRPTLFRPPYGAFNDTTRRAAADCGMTALIHWHAKANGGSMQYQQGDTLQPGDIVLMHFRKEVIDDLKAFTDAAQKANLQTVLLEDWVK